jgi:hypothetical protein
MNKEYSSIGEARKDFIKNACRQCRSKYKCMTNKYRLKVSEKEKFVMIRNQDKKIEISCNYFDKLH